MSSLGWVGACLLAAGTLTRTLHIQDHSCGLSAATLSRATLQIAQLTHITRTLVYINAYSWKPSELQGLNLEP